MGGFTIRESVCDLASNRGLFVVFTFLENWEE